MKYYCDDGILPEICYTCSERVLIEKESGMKKLLFLLIIVLVFPLVVAAQEFELRPGLSVNLPETPAFWKVDTEAPADLLAHMIEHLREDAARNEQAPTDEQLLAAAQKRLEMNDLFVFNPESGAHLLISFSPLGDNESPPSERAIELSAQYAAEGVVDEGWEDVTVRRHAAQIDGARSAQRFEIDYRHEQEQGRFMGVVGFASPYWFWLYANDHLADPDDREVLDSLLRQIRIQAGEKP